MRVARYHQARDIRIEDVPEPTALGPQELLVRPRLCGIISKEENDVCTT